MNGNNLLLCLFPSNLQFIANGSMDLTSSNYGGTGPPDWPEKWKKALFVGLNCLNGQFTARLAIIMALSRHKSQICLEVEPPLGPAAMACKPIFIQVHSGLGLTSRPRARGVILTRQTKTVTNDAPLSTVPGALSYHAKVTRHRPSLRRCEPPLRPAWRGRGSPKVKASYTKCSTHAGLEPATTH